jgi:cell division protein FtsB
MWWLFKTLIAFLFLAFFVIFLVQNNELVSLWPLTGMDWFPVEKVGTSVVYFILLCLGYFFGRISAWSAYAPLRAMLRQQKKENKVLSKEHEKLNHEHEKLNQQYTNLQEEADKAEKSNKFSLNKKIKRWFSKSSEEN